MKKTVIAKKFIFVKKSVLFLNFPRKKVVKGNANYSMDTKEIAYVNRYLYMINLSIYIVRLINCNINYFPFKLNIYIYKYTIYNL